MSLSHNAALKTGLLLGCMITVSACATMPQPLSVSSEFGAATRHNISAHFVEPTPEQKENTFIPADPSRRALARELYRTDEVEKPQPIQTQK